MRAVPLVLVLLTVSLTACRKVPYALPRLGEPKATPAAETRTTSPATPAPVVSSALRPPPAINRSAEVAVLGYHRFVDKVRHPDTEITPGEFEAQMQALKDGGITVISLADFLAWRREEKDIPASSALITIDDGYNTAASVAWPILKRFGYPVTLFLYTDYIRGGPKSGGGSMSWAQLAEMRDAGVAIGSHSVSHRDLRGGKGRTGDAAYEAWLWNELAGSKERLETQLGIKVTALALPYGLSNEHVREMAIKAGYEMVFTVNGAKICFDTPMDALGRWIIPANQPKVFAAAMTFKDTGGSGAAPLTTIPASSVQPVPADNASITDPRPLIQASLESFGPVDPGSVTLRLSGVGPIPPNFDPRTNTVSSQAPAALSPRQYTVILAATAQQKRREARWNFTVQPGKDTHDAAMRNPAR